MTSEEIREQLQGVAKKGMAACQMRDLATAPTVAIIGLEAAAWEIAYQLAILNERAAGPEELELAKLQRGGNQPL